MPAVLVATSAPARATASASPGALGFNGTSLQPQMQPASHLQLTVFNVGHVSGNATALEDVVVMVSFQPYLFDTPELPTEPGWTRVSNGHNGQDGLDRIRTQTFSYAGTIPAYSSASMSLDFPGRHEGPEMGVTSMTFVANATSLGAAVPQQSVVLALGGNVGLADGVVVNPAPGPWPAP